MRKFLLALGIACIASAGMASPSLGLSGLKDPGKSQMVKKSDVKEFRNLKAAGKPASMKKIAPGLSSMTDIITSAEGEKVDVTVTTSGITMSFTGLQFYQDQVYSSHVVYGDNNEVYFYEIFPYLPTQTYFKGVKQGDEIVVDLPQPIYYDDSTGVVEAYYLTLLRYQDDWFVPEEKSSLIFSVDEFGTMTAEGLDEYMMLGVADSEDGQWMGLGAWDVAISSFDETPVELPAGYEVSENYWTSIGSEYAWQVGFAKGSQEIYFKGLSERMPEAWVKATVEYDEHNAIVSIPQDQYVGDFLGYHIFTKCVEMTVDNDGNVFYDDLMDSNYAFQLIWNLEDNTMVAKDPNVVLLFNASMSDVYFVNNLADMKLIHQESFEGVPVDPYGLAFEDEMIEQGFSMFSFNLPAISKDGNYLKLDDLSYVVYVDDEEWVFDADEYLLEESLEEIPWTLDGYWILKRYGSSEHVVAFFVEGITTLGVQSIYKYNGEETRSEIVTINLDEYTSVAAPEADKKVADVKYFDVSGRQVSLPTAGIFVKRVTYEDGTMATFKQIVR